MGCHSGMERSYADVKPVHLEMGRTLLMLP